MAEIRIGTSSFTAKGWDGPFYPRGIKAAERLSYYSTKFDAVEIDSTYYGTPTLSTVQGWYKKTPPQFLFAAKVPQVITHEKVESDTRRTGKTRTTPRGRAPVFAALARECSLDVSLSDGFEIVRGFVAKIQER